MKKSILVSVILLILMLCVSTISLSACKKSDIGGQSVTNTPTEYKMTVAISSDIKEATIDQTVIYTNNTGEELCSLVFYLYPNAYREEAIYPAYFSSLNTYGSLTVSDITSGSEPLTYELSKSATIMTVALKEPLKCGESINVALVSTLVIPECNLRLGKAGVVTNITNFYPILSVFENGAPRKDEFYKVGDPFYSECSNYEVLIECSPDLIVAVGADEVTEVANSYKKVVTAKSSLSRDFAFSVSKNFKVASTEASGVKINYYYTDKEAPEASLQTAVTAIETFTSKFGSYDGKTFNLVDTDYYFGGMEYPRIVFINKNAASKEEIIVHETAHQWFAMGVGSDSINNSWQDEALVSFLTNYYYAVTKGHDVYAELSEGALSSFNTFLKARRISSEGYEANISRSIYDFDTSYEYSMVVYTKGSLMFDGIYKLAGDNKMQTALAKYYLGNLHKNASPKDLYAAFSSVGVDGEGLLKPWLEGSVVTASFY